ncbi:GntR family transcriptional regulator [Amycolatopsis sp. NPDC047767]|uniref:GntR family transcriptional regulator n=1 Tax=Amycolatopsis sp. NPDC047767 TaxID=3156765 RepID=UPI003455801B
MELSRADGHPYQALAADIVGKIESGELQEGDQIESVRTLSKAYGVTNATAQKAVKQLTQDGYAKTVPGLGIFVTGRSERAPADEASNPIDEIHQQLDALQATVSGLAQRLERLESVSPEKS